MEISPPVVANLQPPKAIDPRQRSLHHPPVPPLPLAGLNAPPGDAGGTPLQRRRCPE